MIIPKNNEELKKMIVDGVINCKCKDLMCDFSIDVHADIINAENITAMDITARDIIAGDITARNISYYAVCCAYYNISCSSIIGRRDKYKHFCLDGEIICR